jgi:hypothetical protein
MVMTGRYDFVFPAQNWLDHARFPSQIGMIALGSVHDGEGSNAVVLVGNMISI